MINKTYKLTTLPKTIQQEFLKNMVITGEILEAHRTTLEDKKVDNNKGADLFQVMNENEDTYTIIKESDILTTPVIWGTGPEPDTPIEIKDLSIIKPRIEKTKTEQKHRTKDKAEVFTPSWVVNIQNNSADDISVYKNAFNTPIDENGVESPTGKNWKPNPEKVFNSKEEAVKYISLPRLEITCGEAPYLVSPYDTTNGKAIPVKDENNLYQRVGLLDRKLRIASEVSTNIEEYDLLAQLALKNTYGYEWQGDNLLIARLNILNSYIEYRNQFVEENKENNKLTLKELKKLSKIITWNIWQMDGLKMVLPTSCDESCKQCSTKNKERYYNHQGKASVIKFKGNNTLFEDFIKLNQ